MGVEGQEVRKGGKVRSWQRTTLFSFRKAPCKQTLAEHSSGLSETLLHGYNTKDGGKSAKNWYSTY